MPQFNASCRVQFMVAGNTFHCQQLKPESKMCSISTGSNHDAAAATAAAAALGAQACQQKGA
jgi:hypothetical protein